MRRQSIAKALRRPPAEKVPNGAIRDEIEHAIALSPELTFSEIARRADPPFATGAEVSRLLGRIRTAPKRVNGRLYPARWIREISVENAARLIRAAGLDPVDFDDL